MRTETYTRSKASPRPSAQTAKIREDAYCLDCGWPVVFAHCIDAMAKRDPYSAWNSWIYCSNKVCKHHNGDGVFHNMPSWIKSIVAQEE
jgi:hypothetical protein